MLIRITREMVRRAARHSCKFVTNTGGIQNSEYCSTCIISDAIYNLLPDNLKGIYTVQTVSKNRINLINTVTYKTVKITGDDNTQKVISVFDLSLLTATHPPIDSIYNEMKQRGCLVVEIEDFLDKLDKVEVVYKAYIPRYENGISCCGSKYDLQYRLKDEKWIFPPIGKLFCFDNKASAFRERPNVYKCLALNPKPAIVQARIDGVDSNGRIERFWNEYDPNKAENQYSMPVCGLKDGAMYADAIKILKVANRGW